MQLIARGWALGLVIAATLVASDAPRAAAQNLFEPLIKVNDMAITRYELRQRARMLTLFRAPGDPETLAREQLVEERLKLDAARRNGLTLEDADIRDGMAEFAERADMPADQFIAQLQQAGVSEESFREFVRAGVIWRELTRARFARRIAVSEDDLERARAAVSGRAGVRVLLSEIIMPLQQGREDAVRARAREIAQITSQSAFAAQARQYSAAGTAARGGRLDWTPLNELPPQLRSVILGLAPGDVSDPLPLDGAVALFQLRDIQEITPPPPQYSTIEYATYHIDGGRNAQALARAEQVRADVDVCDDLYGVAQDEPPEVLERISRAPDEIPQDVAMELTKLDPGEVSTNLTRANGETLMLIMLCGRVPEMEGDGPTGEQLTGFIRDRRLNSFADGYLEQLRAEARIVELQ
ncbi:peptidylprolyl isomerase [Roseovarius sp. SYSU LYC5161]|uniref:peptidylprolyl isomerase n=1 Tax=Roseovarius halophilus (ex Wu et al. 2025) TaxID=3376060 RepID=UPI00399BBF90